MNVNRAFVHSHESHALHILLASLVDYAGLFPPASLEMKHAVANFARYREGEYAWMLGRFIVPAARLSEFEAVLPGARRGAGWHISALIGPDAVEEIKAITDFNRRHTGSAAVDSIETKVNTLKEIEHARAIVPDSLLTYFEIPGDVDPRPFLSAVHAVRARAKIRTGGLKPDMFPSSEQVVRFLLACVDARVPFKATAGLHHPVRCVRPLTYDKDAPKGTMHGFLNVFMTAAFALAGMPEPQLMEVLDESDPAAFKFDAKGANWREQRLDNTHLLECRAGLAMSFGSCSVEEPIDDLRSMNLL